MASFSYSRNDEMKHTIDKHFALFVSDGDAASLSNYLIQAKGITADQWEKIRREHAASENQCRALFGHIICSLQPGKFVGIRKSLSNVDLLHEIFQEEEHEPLVGQTVAQGYLTNEEMKHRLEKDFALFMSDGDAASLSNYSIQDKVITSDQWEKIFRENVAPGDEYRALFDHIICSLHPRALVVVRKALRNVDHVQENIDRQQPARRLHEPLVSKTVEQGYLTNEDIKHRLEKNFSLFESDVDASSLSDYLIQDKVITADQWERIRCKNARPVDQCGALFGHLICRLQPGAFLIARLSDKALDKRLKIKPDVNLSDETIDRQEPECHLNEQPGNQPDAQELPVEAQRDERSPGGNNSETEPLLRTRLQNRKCNKKNGCIALLIVALIGLIMGIIVYFTTKETPRCMSEPVHLQTIRITVNSEIRGLAILVNELFVIKDMTSEVEVYDSSNFTFIRRMNVNGLFSASDILSSNINKCLYIFDSKRDGEMSEMFKVHPNGTLIKRWFPGDKDFWTLSSTYEFNIVSTPLNQNKLNVSTSDGQLILTLYLPSDTKISHMAHAIKLTNGNFVVCHGTGADVFHRVCIVDGEANLTKSFGGKPGFGMEQLNEPSYLSLCGNEFIMVADLSNSRVLLLDSDLKLKKEILSHTKGGLRRPKRILLDEANGRLLVADNEPKNHRILIFRFK